MFLRWIYNVGFCRKSDKYSLHLEINYGRPTCWHFKYKTYFWCKIHLWFRYVGGFVRKVDDVTAYLAAQPSRLRAHHRNITTTRWRLCVTILRLQQYSRRLNLFLFFPYFATYQRAICNSSGIVTKLVPVNNCRSESYSSHHHKEIKYRSLETCERGSSPTYGI